MRPRRLTTPATLLLFAILLCPQTAYSQAITPKQILDEVNGALPKYTALMLAVGQKSVDARAHGNSELTGRLNQLGAHLVKAYLGLNQILKENVQDLDQTTRRQRLSTIQELDRLVGEIGSTVKEPDLDKVLTKSSIEAFGSQVSKSLASLPGRNSAGEGGPVLTMTPMILADPSDATPGSNRSPYSFTPPQAIPATIQPGKWIGSMETNGGRVRIFVTLDRFQGGCAGIQCSQTVSGTVATGDETNPVAIEKATIQNNTLTFEIHDNANRLVKFRLTLAGNVLGGEAEVDGQISTVSLYNPVIPSVEPQVGIRVYRVGDGVSAPVVISKVDPEYSEQARTARYEGTVLLSIEVDPTGTARNVKIVRSLGLGLDEKAIEAVKQWRFKPGQKDGIPVTVAATIEVNFRL